MTIKNIKGGIKSFIGKLSILLAVSAFRLKDDSLGGKWICELCKKIFGLLNMSIYRVADASIYKHNTGNVIITDIETGRMGVAGNIIMAGSGEPIVMNKKKLPNLQLNCYKDVCIRGDSDVVVDIEHGYVISEAGYNLADNEEVVDGLLYRTRENVCLLRDNMQHEKEHLSTGIMISGKFSHNYYHIMYENLIRLIFLDKLDIPQEVPILADRKTLAIPSCKRIYDTLTEGLKRDLVLIDNNKIYQIDSLYCISRVNKFPAHVTNPDIGNIEYLYYAPALRTMREKLLKCKSERIFPKRIFITRANSRGRHYNEDEVFEALKPYGFEKVAPEQYSFEEQMSLFNGAEYVVGGSGAAFSNLLFVNKKTTAIIFTRGNYEEIKGVPVFNTIANVCGARVEFFPNMHVGDKNIHANYTIDCDRFAEALKKIIK